MYSGVNRFKSIGNTDQAKSEEACEKRDDRVEYHNPKLENNEQN